MNVDMTPGVRLDAAAIMTTQAPNPLRFLIPSTVLYTILLVLIIVSLKTLRVHLDERRLRRLAQSAAPAAAPAAAPVLAQPIAVVPLPPQVPVQPAHPQPVPVPAVVIDLQKLDLEASMSMNADDVCNICFAHHICVVMRPCNHSYTCKTCGSFFINKPCGLCRQLVTSIESTGNDAGSDSEDSESVEMMAVSPSHVEVKEKNEAAS
eukprot:TRINITY_DN735_c0_g1_i3.p1 TRINITY_DN735_c0_g1~~TRINITY_DN735_c0_g1_i3.p1  ORF type:complete len:207 (+),score=31.50 TRINITY_DN735_c0_g1_i3:382-1002(+)